MGYTFLLLVSFMVPPPVAEVHNFRVFTTDQFNGETCHERVVTLAQQIKAYADGAHILVKIEASCIPVETRDS